MSKLLFLQGLQASGKSTLAHELVAVGGWEEVNKDNLRADLVKTGWVWSQENEKDVLALRDATVEAALKAGLNVVSSDCNFGRKHRNRLAQIAQACGAEFEVKRLDIPLETCLARNRERTGSAKIPESAIIKLWEDQIKENPFVFPVSARPSDFTIVKVEARDDLQKAIICDLDGTLALNYGHRDVYDATRSDEDTLNQTVFDIITFYWQKKGYHILYLTGRDEGYRAPSQQFLNMHGCPPGPLFMRAEGDSRNGSITKLELFNKHIRDRYRVVFCLEDLEKIVKLWRKIGLEVLQVHTDGI